MRVCIQILIVISVLIYKSTFGADLLARELELNGNVSQFLNYKSLEVPDSALLLLDRIPPRRLLSSRKVNISKIKKKQSVVVQTVTANVTTTTLKPSTSKPSDDDDDDSSSRRCVCSLGVCKCCTGLVMDLLNQKACMKVAYHPGDFSFDVAMSWNDRVLYESSMSGKNPRPICISPPRLNNLKMCAKFYNVFFPGRNFHFCLAMNGQWRSYKLFDITFDCLRMGANGIAMLKPDEDGGLAIPNPQGGVDAVIDEGDDIEDYDENVVKSLLDVFDR